MLLSLWKVIVTLVTSSNLEFHQPHSTLIEAGDTSVTVLPLSVGGSVADSHPNCLHPGLAWGRLPVCRQLCTCCLPADREWAFSMALAGMEKSTDLRYWEGETSLSVWAAPEPQNLQVEMGAPLLRWQQQSPPRTEQRKGGEAPPSLLGLLPCPLLALPPAPPCISSCWLNYFSWEPCNPCFMGLKSEEV